MKEVNQVIWNKVLNIIGDKVAKGSCENGCYEEMISELNEIQSYDGKQEIEQLKAERDNLKVENEIANKALERVTIKMFDYADILKEHWEREITSKEITSWDIPKHIARFKKEAGEKLKEEQGK